MVLVYQNFTCWSWLLFGNKPRFRSWASCPRDLKRWLLFVDEPTFLLDDERVYLFGVNLPLWGKSTSLVRVYLFWIESTSLAPIYLFGSNLPLWLQSTSLAPIYLFGSSLPLWDRVYPQRCLVYRHFPCWAWSASPNLLNLWYSVTPSCLDCPALNTRYLLI